MAKKKIKDDYFPPSGWYSADSPEIKKMKEAKAKQDKEGKNIYYLKNGKEQSSFYDFIKGIGLLDRLKAKGITINPTHNFELLKNTRQELFEKAKQDLITKRNLYNLQTTDFHLNSFYLMWLENELKVIDEWLNSSKSNSDNLEIAIYKNDVNERIIKYEKLLEPKEKEIIKGFQSNLTPTQIETLFKQLKGSYIDENTNPKHFKAIFKNETLPDEIKIIWIDKGQTRHEPNKQTLFELFYLLKDYKYLDNSNFDTIPTNQNNFYRKLEKIFPDLKNFGNSNPYKSQGKTPKQKQLEQIILTLKS